MDKIAVLTKVFSYFKAGLSCSKEATAYLKKRAIDHQAHEIGCSSGGLQFRIQTT